MVHRLYADIVGAYWPPERRIVEDGYRTLPFPFDELAAPEFEMVHSWNLEHLMGYLGVVVVDSAVSKGERQRSACAHR